MKYINAEKLIERLEEMKRAEYENCGGVNSKTGVLQEVQELIDSLQQEQLKDKQVVVITESHGDANIEWDCRSLSDVIVLLKSAGSFITEKQIKKIAGPGSGPDYATTEGRYSHLFKSKQEQPDGLDEEVKKYWNAHAIDYRIGRVADLDFMFLCARHFAEWGAIHLNARKEE